MKIAVAYATAHGAAWAVSEGLVSTLMAMGHLVLDIPQNPFLPYSINWWDMVDMINEGDLFMMSGADLVYAPAYCGYQQDQVQKPFPQVMHRIRTRTVGLYTESSGREDRKYSYDSLSGIFDHNFYPARQDAEAQEKMHSGRNHWLPFGVDTDIFFPMGSPRNVSFGFIGNIYTKRQQFLNELQSIRSTGIPPLEVIQTPPLPSRWETARLLAKAYNTISVSVVLPSYSQLIVTKVVEAMACGCCVLAPRLYEPAAANMQIFEDGKDIIFYEPTPTGLLEVMIELAGKPDFVERIASEAAISAKEKHALKQRLATVLATVFSGD
jgi:hypothetical protein